VTAFPQRDVEVLGGVRLRYIDVGEGAGPPLVLLHGLASRLEEYEDLVGVLSKNRRVLALDLPGNGYSDKPDRPYTLSFFEDSVLGFLDALGVRDAAIGGGSLGGNLTLRLGHRAPDRFTRLVAWAPAGVWDPMPHYILLGRLFRWLRPFWPVVWVQSRFWYRRSWPGRERALRDAFAHYREIMSRGFVRMYFDLGVEQATSSLFPLAPKIKQPTLLVWGDEDHALNMGAGIKKLAKILPNARLCVFHGARHSLASEVPLELAERIDDFLQDHLESAAA
jgi:pimeloyl-ACP methyl ester carboxylesterase